jgi:hypothetical protein
MIHGRKFELLLFFDYIDAVPKIREMSCSVQEKGSYFLKILSNLDISTMEVCMARKHRSVISKERFRPEQQLVFRTKNFDVAMSLESCRNPK